MTVLQVSKIDELTEGFEGEVLLPTHPEYADARKIWNAMIDKRPAIIARCATTSDVVRGVNFARENGLVLAVRGGGHNIAGNAICDDGLVIDLSKMKAARVDPAARRVTIEGGATLADLDAATQAHGLATPTGINSTTGIAGLTLGGGIGWLSRKYGMTIDNLESVQLVTAVGEVIRASATEHPDLFWALRGGGGNFGVVTSMEFRLHPVSTVFAGPVLYPLDRATEALRLSRDFMATAPRELSAFFAFLIVPPGPPFPEHLHGKTMCGVVCVYCGGPAAGAAAARRLLEFGPPAFAHMGPVPYPMVQCMFDPLLPPGLHHYWKADFVNELTDEIIAEHVK